MFQMLKTPPLNSGFDIVTEMKKARQCRAFGIMVARGGIEPPTRGFSILCSTD